MPAWMSVASVSVHDASRHPPPIPIQVEEYSASPARRCFAFGTTHSPEIAWNVVFFSSAPCTYPDQLNDWFAATTTIGRAFDRVASPHETNRSSATSRDPRTIPRAAARVPVDAKRTRFERSPCDGHIHLLHRGPRAPCAKDGGVDADRIHVNEGDELEITA